MKQGAILPSSQRRVFHGHYRDWLVFFECEKRLQVHLDVFLTLYK